MANWIRILLTLPLFFLSHGASAQLADVELNGRDKLSVSLKGAASGKATSESTTSFDVAANGDVTYSNADGFGFEARVTSDGKKPVLVIDPGDVPGLQDALTAAINAAGLGVTVDNLVVDVAKLKSKLSAKEKDGDINAKTKISSAFVAQSPVGEVTGKFALAADVSTIPLCTVCGATYMGVEKFKQSLKGCGSLSGSGNASLAIAADDDEDGTATIAYTDSDGVTLTGSVTQDGKKLSCALDAAGMTALEDSLEAIIQDECEIAATVDITGEKCTGKTGDGVSFSIGVNFDAANPMLGMTTGKSAAKGSLTEVP